MTPEEIEKYREGMKEGTVEVVDGEVIIKLPETYLEMQNLTADIYLKAKEAGDEKFEQIIKSFKASCKRILNKID